MLPTELPNDNASETAEPSPTSTPAIPQPQQNFATREDLMQVVDSFKEAMASALQTGGLSRGVVPQASTDITDDEVMAAINEGKPAAVLSKWRDQIEDRVRSKYIDPIQAQNLSTVTGLVRDAAKVDPKMPYFIKFEKEIDKLVNGVPLAQRASIDTYRTAYNIVVGGNVPAIIREEVEKAMRAGGANDGGQTPNGATKAGGGAPGVPSVTELLGADAQLALTQHGWDADTYAKRFLKQPSWAEAAKMIQKQNEEHPTNA